MFSSTLLTGYKQTLKQILQIVQKLVKKPNLWEVDQLAFYKEWRSLIWDHQT